MSGTYPRQTVRNSLTWAGLGLHSGTESVVRFHPARDGLWLRNGARREALSVDLVISTARCTCLSGAATVEHFLAALAGLGITDGEIELEGREIPGLDGSAQGFVEALLAGGFEPCGSMVATGPFARQFHVGEGLKLAAGKGEGHWRYVFDLSPDWPGEQVYETFLTPEVFATEIAPARTVVLEKELAMVRQAGLGQGLREGDVVVIGQEGYIGEARFPDEPARHKLLDLIGDLALLGVPVQHLNLVSEKGGHTSNITLAQKLARVIQIERQD